MELSGLEPLTSGMPYQAMSSMLVADLARCLGRIPQVGHCEPSSLVSVIGVSSRTGLHRSRSVAGGSPQVGQPGTASQ